MSPACLPVALPNQESLCCDEENRLLALSANSFTSGEEVCDHLFDEAEKPLVSMHAFQCFLHDERGFVIVIQS